MSAVPTAAASDDATGPPAADAGPERADWTRDAAASVVVFLVALPLCLGVALASGAPLMAGIIAGIVGGLLVAPISGSPLMVSGPAAGLTAIVLAAITELGSFPLFCAAVVVAGALQAVFGLLRAGAMAAYVPSAVIKGMLAAIGLILILKQLPHAFGYDANFLGEEAFEQPNHENTITGITHIIGHVEPVAIAASLAALVLLIAWPRLARGRLALVPGALLAVTAGILLNWLAAQVVPGLALGPSHLVSLPVPASPSDALAAIAVPDFGRVSDPVLLRIALTLAVVASLESLLSLEATDRLDPARRISPPNRELIAQGVGNMASGLLGGLPVTGVIVRSAANITAGARTRLSAILHGGLLLIAVVAIPALLNRIPLAALAAILIFTGFKLASPSLIRATWQQGWESFVPFAVTVLAILATDLLVGIAIGLSVAAGVILRSHLASPGFRPVHPPGAVLLRYTLDDQVTFLSKVRLLRLLNNLPTGARIEIDGRQSRRIDRDVLEMLHEFTGTARERGIDYRLVGIPDPGSDAAAAH